MQIDLQEQENSINNETESALARISQYYAENEYVPKLRKEVLMQSLLLVVSLSGAPLYLPPAYKYGSEVTDNEFIKLSYAVGTTTLATAILYNSSIIFFDMHFSDIPVSLRDILIQVQSKYDRLAENIKISRLRRQLFAPHN